MMSIRIDTTVDVLRVNVLKIGQANQNKICCEHTQEVNNQMWNFVLYTF